MYISYMSVCIYVCICVGVYTHMCVCIYIHIYTLGDIPVAALRDKTSHRRAFTPMDVEPQ